MTSTELILQELVNALDEQDRIARDMEMHMLMHAEYREQRNRVLHRIDQLRTQARQVLNQKGNSDNGESKVPS